MDWMKTGKRRFNETTDDEPACVDVNKTVIDAIRSSNHDFSFSLYMELAKYETGNIFYSPFSIHVIMFMASVGAASKTFDEITAIIHLNKNNHSMEAYKILLENLTMNMDHIKLAIGMFVDTAFNVKDSFVFYMEYLKLSMKNVDFKNDPEQQRQYINNLVLNKTDNKIKDTCSEGTINSATTFILANALHFKCRWHFEFRSTSEDLFYITSANIVTVKMMTLCEELGFYHDNKLKFSALKLPYIYNLYDMIILLPDDKHGLAYIENNFSKINLLEILNKLSTYKVTVKLPRFKIEQSLQLKTILSRLGCSTMFTKEANFFNIVENKDLLVSNVVHKAYVDVNERGTEAAAYTGCRFNYLSEIYGLPTANFVADHPFIFSIMSPTKDVLFMGRLSQP